MSIRWFAPGRVNLIGDHTDYQLGWVLPFAIARGTVVTVDLTKTSTLKVRSNLFDEIVFRDLDRLQDGPSGWAAYVEGALVVAQRHGLALDGVEVAVSSTVPVGVGLASSASVTCATLAALHEATEVDATAESIALMAQEVENDYVRAGVGYMDPAAVMLGRSGHALAIDTRDRSVEAVPLRVADAGLALLLVDTGQQHQTRGGAYSTRVAQCRQAAEHLGVPSLRDVADPREVATIADPVVRSRARHVVTENLRVGAAVEMLRAGRVREVGALMVASHESLRDDFEVSTPALDAVVGTVMDIGAVGARVTGAGFGGSVLVLADRDLVPTLTEAVVRAFDRRRWSAPTIDEVVPSRGAHRLE